ncbi:class II aldolase/adducin family protein [uncultured Paludibaculum sp.]|uniref:class II aldolase/adducin family protein n=1 Tax=uncultured Paludibaculum sp. TaxID=1765020 RepID=UPI002AAB79E5|nr:class II aldolase/adducin family protein [uncultured Paludibaculum sp.]
MNPHLHPRDEILLLMERIYRYRMTTTSGGNLSIREPNGDVWITPARIDKGALRREDIVLVRADGSIEGSRRPSSELPLHQAIYRGRPDVRGIVHAHPVALVAFSMVRAVPDTRLFHQSWHVCGAGGFAAYELPGSAALGTTVAATFEKGFDCVILENHGVVTAGADLQQAFRRFETFEFAGKTIIKANLLGRPVRYLTDDEIALPQRRQALPEFERKAASSQEKEVRRRLCEFVQRAYRQRLFISTQGSYSARVDATSFLITPYEIDRGTIQPGDLVLVHGGQVESGGEASRAAAVHDAIYATHPQIGSIINAYPVNATAFSVTGSMVDTRTIPESYVVVRRPAMAPYGLQFEDPAALASMLSPMQPTVILENDGVLVTGSDVLEVFDRLEVIESTAEAFINSRAVGTLSPMSDEVIAELDRVFLGM